MSKVPNYEGVPFSLVKSRSNQVRHEENLPQGRKPKKAEDKTGTPPSRFSLRMSAGWWRRLQYIGMSLHFCAPPRPPSPDFDAVIPSTVSDKRGIIKLYFYTPKGYRRTGLSTDKSSRVSYRYPVVVNFHGGGFTLGAATDDARFARAVTERCNAVFISVEYRLAPEYPFPTAVDDGVDALMYIIRSADELRIDPCRLATSGFSAGGNIAITAPLRLASLEASGASASECLPRHSIVAVAAWYPITDYTLTRAERRRTANCPAEALLPSNLTDLFDASYLYPPELDLAQPHLSPSKASDRLLQVGIPPHVILYTCELDMLLQEGEKLAKRLSEPPISKNVSYRMISGVPHGWDKGPNPVKPPAQAAELYDECCEKLRAAFMV